MSFGARASLYLEALFKLNPEGLRLKDLKAGVLEFEPAARRLGNSIEYDISKAMCFEERPLLERYRLGRPLGHAFWYFRKGRYFLKETARDYLKIKRPSAEDTGQTDAWKCEHASSGIVARMINSKRGATLKEIRLELGRNFPGVDGPGMDDLLESVMQFDLKDPYMCVYVDKAGSERWGKGVFTKWRYENGAYYPKGQEKPSGREKNVRKAAEHDAARFTLTGQLRDYAKLQKMTNTKFIRMHAYAMANIEASYK